MEKWVGEHIDKISIEDLMEYDDIRKKPGYVAVTVFAFCLGPQYWLLNQEIFRHYVRRDLRGKVVGGLIGLSPLFISILSAQPSQRRKQAYLRGLQQKYAHLL